MSARSCEALGICQNPHQECSGSCEQVPRLPALDKEPVTLTDVLIYGAILFGTLIIVAIAALAVWIR